MAWVDLREIVKGRKHPQTTVSTLTEKILLLWPCVGGPLNRKDLGAEENTRCSLPSWSTLHSVAQTTRQASTFSTSTLWYSGWGSYLQSLLFISVWGLLAKRKLYVIYIFKCKAYHVIPAPPIHTHPHHCHCHHYHHSLKHFITPSLPWF